MFSHSIFIFVKAQAQPLWRIWTKHLYSHRLCSRKIMKKPKLQNIVTFPLPKMLQKHFLYQKYTLESFDIVLLDTLNFRFNLFRKFYNIILKFYKHSKNCDRNRVLYLKYKCISSVCGMWLIKREFFLARQLFSYF
jgi:hypothetical protein